jgi:hypothetical protein
LYIAKLFFENGTVVHDTSNDGSIDPFYNKPWSYPKNMGDTDDHAYPDWTNNANYNSNVYLPSGGELLKVTSPRINNNQYLGKSNTNNDGFANVYLPNRDITVSLYHITNVQLKKLSNGRTKIGTFGAGTGGELSKHPSHIVNMDWVHIHINVYKGRQLRRGNKKLPLSSICPKNLR